MRYQQYKFKFYMDARHAIYIGGKLGEVHPVSYTHLDVYKRQGNRRLFLRTIKDKIIGIECGADAA